MKNGLTGLVIFLAIAVHGDGIADWSDGLTAEQISAVPAVVACELGVRDHHVIAGHPCCTEDSRWDLVSPELERAERVHSMKYCSALVACSRTKGSLQYEMEVSRCLGCELIGQTILQHRSGEKAARKVCDEYL